MDPGRDKRKMMMEKRGRPTKYSEDLQKKADRYVNGEHADAGDVVPTMAGLACHLHINRSTVHEWIKTNEIFSDTLDRLMMTQERMLVSGGITGAYNSTISKLMLANHGYSEKIQQDQVCSDGSMTAPTKIEIIAVDATSSEH